MNALQKNWLFLNKTIKQLVIIFVALCFIFIHKAKGQKIANYVFNGSFEEKYNCDPPYIINKAIGWSNIGSDTNALSGSLHSMNCFFNAPNTGIGFQYPKSGQTFARTTPYCTNPCTLYASRGYPKNRMKANLEANKTYCVKMYACRQNDCPHAVSDFGLYFGDNTTDTIKYCNTPITYLTPQVSNPISNIIIDTVNWVAISGTFVATGTEKYLVLGNFNSNAATTSSLVDNSWGTGVWAEYFVDDISCIEVNLPAYAGADKSVIPGDSVYIGRELDFAVDSGCTWFKLPNTTTSIKKASGLWVKPTSTSTYVVKQVLECSSEKWDTVVVYMNPLGIVSSSGVENDLKLYPVPANDYVELSSGNYSLLKEFNKVRITNQLGQTLKEEELHFENKPVNIKTDDLTNGVYFISLSNSRNERITKKLVISK